MPLSRGRVLAPPAVDPAGATALAPPPSAGRRVLPEALVRARAEAEAIVDAARAEAAAIVAEARQQAASARADAEREGRAAGEAALAMKAQPWRLKPEDFFTHSERLRGLFARLVGADA
ncbi:MAG TPA: hypothetical protein VFS00_24850, partial [Polyangiaceae bacterium]|nr:hypothetical protein [Polyangiaceae bacterium]